MKSDRPFDSLIESIGTEVSVKLKDGLLYTGRLVSFDMHLNIVLEDVCENSERINENILIRGDMISTIKHNKSDM